MRNEVARVVYRVTDHSTPMEHVRRYGVGARRLALESMEEFRSSHPDFHEIHAEVWTSPIHAGMGYTLPRGRWQVISPATLTIERAEVAR